MENDQVEVEDQIFGCTYIFEIHGKAEPDVYAGRKRVRFPKNRQREILTRCVIYAFDRGARHTPQRLHSVELPTVAGVYSFTPYYGESIVSIMGRFELAARAAQILGDLTVNQHSGKMNFACSFKDDPDVFFSHFVYHLNKVTPYDFLLRTGVLDRAILE